MLSSERTLNAHVRQVHQKHTHNQFCPHCKFSTYEKYRLDKHIEQHNKVKDFRCDLCDYLAVNKKAVEDHVRSKHSKGKKRKYEFSCSLCPETVKTKKKLKDHMWSEHCVIQKD